MKPLLLIAFSCLALLGAAGCESLAHVAVAPVLIGVGIHDHFADAESRREDERVEKYRLARDVGGTNAK